MKVILINGPPGSGKDTFADCLKLLLSEEKALFEKFAEPLKSGINLKNLLGREVLGPLYEEKDETIKRQIPDARQLYIAVANYIVSKYGKDFFANRVISVAENHDLDWLVVSDLGFVEELNAFLKRNYEVHVVNLMREGCSYQGDKREPVYYDDMSIIINSGTKEDLYREAELLLEHLRSE